MSQWNVNTELVHSRIPLLGKDHVYDITFVQNGSNLSGTLTDGYYPITGPLVGSINGDAVTFTFDYPLGSIQGQRTYEGNIDSSGMLVGKWSDSGPGGYDGDFGIPDFATELVETCEWSDFVKIVAVPESATKVNSYWMSEDGVEIGPEIWGSFAIIQEVSDDPCEEGIVLMNYKSELRSGLGNW